jgi:hypothetical protein
MNGLMIASRRKPFPQVIDAFDRSPDRDDRRSVRFNGCREDAFETVVVNSRQILPQDSRTRLARPQDCSAKLRTGCAKEAEIRVAVLPWIKPVDFTGDSEYGQSVGIVQRHGEPQYSQLPGTQRFSVPLHPLNVRIH